MISLKDNCACPSSDIQIHHMKFRKKKNGVFYFAECIEKNIHCKELEDIAQNMKSLSYTKTGVKDYDIHTEYN